MKTTLSSAAVDDTVSALADGELRTEEFASALVACERKPALLASWHHYHLIGDVLRWPDLLAPRRVSPFLTRLQSQLAKEAILPVAPTGVLLLLLTTVPLLKKVAGNVFNFRWKLLASVASMASVVVLVWTVAAPTPSTGSQLAQSLLLADSVLVALPQGVMVRDARLVELLAGHHQVGGNSALQMPSRFLRNATFETSSHAGR